MVKMTAREQANRAGERIVRRDIDAAPPISKVWVEGATGDPIVTSISNRLRSLGVSMSSPDDADWAVVILSPALANDEPPALRRWISDRHVETLVLAVGSGRALWDDEVNRFTSDTDSVPQSLREAITSRPIVFDLRHADGRKRERVAQRIAGAVMSRVAKPSDRTASTARRAPTMGWLRSLGFESSRKRRRAAVICIVVAAGAAVLGAWGLQLGLGRLESTAPSGPVPSVATSSTRVPTTSPTGNENPTTLPASPGPTTVPLGSASSTSPVQSTSVPTTRVTSTTNVPQATASRSNEPASNGSDEASSWLPWTLVVVLSLALLASVGVQLRRRHQSRQSPLPVGSLNRNGVQVFISHDTEADGEIARNLAASLQQRQLPVWMAPTSIPAGEPWVFAIEKGLITSGAAVVLMSPAALSSGWVRREIQMIVDLEVDGRIRVLPVRVAPCDVPLILRAYQWVDLRSFDSAADELCRRFGSSSAHSS